MNKQVGLNIFLKSSCANYDHYYGGCLFKKTCKVEQGERCNYFEKAVLPTAMDIGQSKRLYSFYEKYCKINKHLQKEQERTCPDCGIGLRPHQKYCDKCNYKRRKKTQREYQKKYRLQNR